MPTRLKGLPRLPGIKGIGDIGRKRKRALPQPVDVPGEMNLVDPRVNEIYSRLGKRSTADFKLAKRVATLMGQYPDGTIPELVTLDWLEQQKIPYTYQAWIYGGRSRQGGVIPDFVLESGGRGMAWLVQGDYWHSKAEVSSSDVSDKLKLLGVLFHGVRIEEVVELWENKIYSKRPQVFEWALMGIEMGR